MSAKPKAPARADREAAARAARQSVLDSGLPMGDSLDAGDLAGTKSRILDTAITLFAERGFEACTMRGLASEVGIRAPAIYNHYSSKDQVLAAAMEQILGKFFWDLLGDLDELPVEEWLETIVRGHVFFQLQHPRHARANDALMGAPGIERILPSADYKRLIGAQRGYITLLRRLVELRGEGLDSADDLMVAFSITASGDRVAAWFDPDGDLSPEDIAERSWRLVERMLKKTA